MQIILGLPVSDLRVFAFAFRCSIGTDDALVIRVLFLEGTVVLFLGQVLKLALLPAELQCLKYSVIDIGVGQLYCFVLLHRSNKCQQKIKLLIYIYMSYYPDRYLAIGGLSQC